MKPYFRRIAFYIFWFFVELAYQKRKNLKTIVTLIKRLYYRSSARQTEICLVTNGEWCYRNKEFDSSSHSYFSAGASPKLAQSIAVSKGKTVLLRGYKFKFAIVRAHWSGRDV
jgi:hypothetical protein